MRQVKCKHCGNQGLASEMKLNIRASKTGRQYKEYYHEECLNLKNARERTVELFYQYTGSLEPIKMINIAFKQMAEQGLNEKEILYVMEYIIKNKCVLNYAMGIKYYATPAIKEYRSRQNFLLKQKVNQEKTNSIGIITNENKSEKPKIEVEDSLDISDFI